MVSISTGVLVLGLFTVVPMVSGAELHCHLLQEEAGLSGFRLVNRIAGIFIMLSVLLSRSLI